MTLSIILFFVFLVIAFGMIIRRVWQIRTGKIIFNETFEETDWTELSVESVRTRLVELLKFAVHHSVLFVLKLWIIISYLIRNVDKFIRERLTHLLHKNAHRPITTSEKPSDFINDMKAHKEEIHSELIKEAPLEEKP